MEIEDNKEMDAEPQKKQTHPGQCDISGSRKGQGPARVKNTTEPEEYPPNIPDSNRAQDPRNFQG